jgi:septal ring factor EnvC (AmiA/AmiB activator)
MEEVTRALEIKDGKVSMITTATKIDVSEQVIDIDKLEKMIASLENAVPNNAREIIRVQANMNEEVARLEKQIVLWQADVADLQKQIDVYKLLEKDLPKEDGLGETGIIN